MGQAKLASHNENLVSVQPVSPLSQELVIGLVGYAGAGCSTVALRLSEDLEKNGYKVQTIKLSLLIQEWFAEPSAPDPARPGRAKFNRAQRLQDLGSGLR